MSILVTGANGQPGDGIRCMAATSLNSYIFTDVTKLDTTGLDAVRNMIHLDNIKVVVNCTAYTNVDKVEDDYDMADLLNSRVIENLVVAAKEVSVTLTYISIDYIFQDDRSIPCEEDCEANPLGIYDKTKRAGEQNIQRVGCNYLTSRMTWLYSRLGKDFVKTMRQLIAGRNKLRVVLDQIGTSTYTEDSADTIYRMIEGDQYHKRGIYHLSNEGVCPRYDFAKETCKLSGSSCDIQPCHSDEFPGKVRRPHSSVLDKTKLKLALSVEIPYWKDSLVKCTNELKENN